jgi:hypothetical protein
MNGEVGNTTALNSFTNNVITTFGGTDVYTYGDQNYYLPLTLVNDARFFSTTGNVNVLTTVDGLHPFVIAAGGNVVLADSVGGSSPVESITLSGSNINLNGASMASVGNQVYNGSIMINGNTTFTTSAANSSITLNQGVNGSGHLIGGANSTNRIYFYGTQATLPTITYSNAEYTQGTIGSQIFFTNFNVFTILLPTAAPITSATTPIIYTTIQLPGSLLNVNPSQYLLMPTFESDVDDILPVCMTGNAADCDQAVLSQYSMLNTGKVELEKK